MHRLFFRAIGLYIYQIIYLINHLFDYPMAFKYTNDARVTYVTPLIWAKLDGIIYRLHCFILYSTTSRLTHAFCTCDYFNTRCSRIFIVNETTFFIRSDRTLASYNIFVLLWHKSSYSYDAYDSFLLCLT